MIIFIDTNVLISAVLNKKGTAALAYEKAVSFPNRSIICEQNIQELRRIFLRKFPHKLPILETFLKNALDNLELVPIPSEEAETEQHIRDENDRPLLRAALSAGADIFLTGDKDFLDSNIKKPKIMPPSSFLQYKA
ncbi:MAG: putative toxin-antitoxin system toxin component, PIN family [bacterium]|nr:putative toxin-antitoxin system toxin component, PIN family [bacterium]